MDAKKELLNKYINGKCSPSEAALVEDWFSNLNSKEQLSDVEIERMLSELDHKMIEQPKSQINWGKLGIAASIIGILFFATITYIQQKTKIAPQEFNNVANIYAPKNTFAQIQEGSGEFISLENLKILEKLNLTTGEIQRISENEFKFIGKKDISSNLELSFIVPKGGNSVLTMEDGSKIWANENSKISFNNNFLNDRTINLNGEVFFEVLPLIKDNEKQPFKVQIDEYAIQVLGTKFNVNYKDKIQVALLEGAVQISDKENHSVKLMSNELFDGKEIKKISDFRPIISWKDDQFSLTNKDIFTFSEELSSWYGVEFVIDKSIQNKLLYGNINRRLDLEQVLKSIKKVIPIHYTLENNKIRIQPSET